LFSLTSEQLAELSKYPTTEFGGDEVGSFPVYYPEAIRNALGIDVPKSVKTVYLYNEPALNPPFDCQINYV